MFTRRQLQFRFRDHKQNASLSGGEGISDHTGAMLTVVIYHLYNAGTVAGAKINARSLIIIGFFILGPK